MENKLRQLGLVENQYWFINNDYIWFVPTNKTQKNIVMRLKYENLLTLYLILNFCYFYSFLISTFATSILSQ